jgi:hypothetical protein
MGFEHRTTNFETVRQLAMEFPDEEIVVQGNNGGPLTGRQFIEKLDSCVKIELNPHRWAEPRTLTLSCDFITERVVLA